MKFEGTIEELLEIISMQTVKRLELPFTYDGGINSGASEKLENDQK